MRVLFLVPHPTEGASTRYRVEQYLPFLERHGIQCTLRPFLSSRFYRLLYRPGRY
ncbi:MAG: glycosyltransferase family 1 protein, partial [Deltaproteobacteria bacterium]|nr:glycosyltransferase family 1 protein [Deltaproteobacteria bacterium]